MTTLRLADGFELPLEAVTVTFAILAKRGSGKTSTAVVLAEEMISAGHSRPSSSTPPGSCPLTGLPVPGVA